MEEIIKFLLDYGGPVIRYRTLTELLNSNDKGRILKFEEELLEYDETKKRLEYITSKEKLYDFNGVHGSTNHHLENALPMVLDFGIKKGIKAFDDRMDGVINRIKKSVFPKDHVFHRFIDIIIIPFLYKAGYRENWIIEFMHKRLETLYQFTSKKDYDIYDDQNKYTRVPKTFRNRKIIKPELYQGGNFQFPLIYDLYGLSDFIDDVDDVKQNQIETIIEYIINPTYQEFYDGYGILYNGNHQYLAMGWDAKLPEIKDIMTPEILKRAQLLAHFETAVNHPWFLKVMKKIETYKTDNGTYELPKSSLKESTGCWVKSRHMSLGENRRKKRAYELESTFRVLKIFNILKQR